MVAVTLARKRSRRIVVDGRAYRWRLRSRPTYSRGLCWVPCAYAVEDYDRPGRTLIVRGSFIGSASVGPNPRALAAGSPSSRDDSLGCLPDHSPHSQCAGSRCAPRRFKGRGAARASPRECRAAPAGRTGQVHLGGPAVVLRSLQPAPTATLGHRLPDYPGHTAGLAPSARCPHVGLQRTTIARTATDRHGDPEADHHHGQGTTQAGATAASRASCTGSATTSPRPRSGKSCTTPAWIPHHDEPDPPGGPSCAPRPSTSSPWTSCTSTRYCSKDSTP